MKYTTLLACLLFACSALAQTPGQGGGGTTSPGGSSLQIQYNNASTFSGVANSLVYPTPVPVPAAPVITNGGTPGARLVEPPPGTKPKDE